MVNYTQLSYEERVQIEILKLEGYSCRSIAKALGRHHTTVSREIKRNFPTGDYCYHYDAEEAQETDRHRRSGSRNRGWLRDHIIKRYVRKKLKAHWSPEQISGRLPVDIPNKSISHESIYCYIYRHEKNMIAYLARKRPRRIGHTYFYKSRGNRIPFRIDISTRPEVINSRRQFGHWEADNIVGKQSSTVLSVLVERTSRLVKIAKVRDKQSILQKESIIKRLSPLDESARKSITYDNGPENALHYVINAELDMKSYFCKPYHSWEKGTIENTNGLIRRYLPKKTDFSLISSAKIKQIETALNNRPRKCLSYKTPNEVFKEMASGALSY